MPHKHYLENILILLNFFNSKLHYLILKDQNSLFLIILFLYIQFFWWEKYNNFLEYLANDKLLFSIVNFLNVLIIVFPIQPFCYLTIRFQFWMKILNSVDYFSFHLKVMLFKDQKGLTFLYSFQFLFHLFILILDYFYWFIN